MQCRFRRRQDSVAFWDNRAVQHYATFGYLPAARRAERGRVDVLVNNAAVHHLGTIEHTPEDVLRRLLEVETVGPFLGIRTLLAPMRAQGGGSIVNVGSLDSLTGMNGLTAYCTSKWGLRGLAKAAALELGRSGIRVDSVCPAGGNMEMYGPWLEQMAGFMDETRTYLEDRAIPGQATVEAIADDDDTIAAALEDVSIPTSATPLSPDTPAT